MLSIEPYTIGIGDRFAHQGRAQLEALVRAREVGINAVSGLEQVPPRTRFNQNETG